MHTSCCSSCAGRAEGLLLVVQDRPFRSARSSRAHREDERRRPTRPATPASTPSPNTPARECHIEERIMSTPNAVAEPRFGAAGSGRDAWAGAQYHSGRGLSTHHVHQVASKRFAQGDLIILEVCATRTPGRVRPPCQRVLRGRQPPPQKQATSVSANNRPCTGVRFAVIGRLSASR